MSEAVLPAAPPAPLRPAWREWIARGLQARTDDLRLALATLSGHKLRSFLTLLGIVIGVFTVVAMMALLDGLQRSLSRTMGQLGADVFQIQKWPNFSIGQLPPDVQARKKITLAQALQLREALPDAKQVGPELWEYGKEMSAQGNIDQGVQVAGGTPEFFTNTNLAIATGRTYNEGEALDGARVVVIGAAVVDALFAGQDPIGQRVRLGRLDLQVVGTLERQGGLPLDGNPDNVAAIPISLFGEIYGTSRSISVSVMAKEHREMAKVQDLAMGAFRRIRGLSAQQENDFEVFSNDSARAMFDDLAGKVNLVMFVICGFSLLVGGIGVMNIMLVAVAERTREIGLRKALGARRSRILAQFVIEAVVLAFCGGLIGVLLGYGMAAVGRFALDVPATVPPWAVAVSLGVSGGIGLLFGIYPAARASRLDPAVALRDE
ncbi:MAG TPA: ABC transporter permease [Myxococcales bacterium]|nr:ABC transporter permease [Myxococcales bacterium]